ncbi:hypothetical protein AKJ58_00035 [candidate division MSBL1 archaeon SCGC-AAA385D11]|uniref:Predicted 3'-5' exonuclease PolB-like domain-containing protein n=1 Tax=candidate division MSBL1 archaeon SCGC-AAA385D11 TaxID=1698286 RepID=A0A133VPL7_9EURY|nr:hypothetical protein AKJ58_00035 [candidate division MSBL1 archaeon SCGC-AAA385D11]
MNYIALDIETAPLQISDEVVIDYQIRKRFKRNLHPAFARVVAVGLLLPGEDYPLTRSGANEINLIKSTWDSIRKTSWDKLVTWNGLRFDIPFLKVRSRLLGITPNISVDTSKYSSPEDSNHIDCMWLLQGECNEIPPISLEIAARLFGIKYDESKKLTPLEISECFEAGKYSSIEECCSEDVKATAKIFEKLLPTIGTKPLATKKQVSYIIDIAKKLNIELDRPEVESWSKKEASEWIDKHKLT